MILRATRYVAPLREGGSLPGLVEAEDDGLYVAKFGLEQYYNADLVGSPVPPKSISDLFRERPRVGNTLVSTIDTRLQKAALDALAGRRGGVVALNPKTGAVLVA